MLVDDDDEGSETMWGKYVSREPAPLRPVPAWRQRLRIAVGVVLNSGHPRVVLWRGGGARKPPPPTRAARRRLLRPAPRREPEPPPARGRAPHNPAGPTTSFGPLRP